MISLRTAFVSLIIMWGLEGIRCIPFPLPLPGIVVKPPYAARMLKETAGHDHKSDFLRAESKIVKRDLWELVSASSDVIPVDPGKNSTIVSSSSPRYQLDSSSSSSSTHQRISSNFMSQMSSDRNIQMRLNKLEYYFSGLRIFEEDCRQRLICEMSQEPAKFSPLSSAFLDETSYNGDEKVLSARLLTSAEGTRLLTYIEAANKGLNREGCQIWAYRCPQTTENLIDFKSLLTWREVLKWLTVKMVAKRRTP